MKEGINRVSAGNNVQGRESSLYMYEVRLILTEAKPTLYFHFLNYPSLADLAQSCDLAEDDEYGAILTHSNWPEEDPEDHSGILVIVESDRKYIGSIIMEKHKLFPNAGPMCIRESE